MNDQPEARLALWLADQAQAGGTTLFIARSEARMDRLAAAAAGFCAGRAELLVLPPWDVLPYDRTAPSANAICTRVATLARLAAPALLPRLVITTAEAALQRVPPPAAWAGAAAELRVGAPIDPEALCATLVDRGFHSCEQVVDPGEVALRGHVLDVYPGGAHAPVRVEVGGGRIGAMHFFAPRTQRSLSLVDRVVVYPATEFPLDPEHPDEHAALPSGELVPLFDYLPGAATVLDDGTEARWEAFREVAEDAFKANRQLRRRGTVAGVLPAPGRLFLTAAAAARHCVNRLRPGLDGMPLAPPRRAADLIAAAKVAATPVVIATPGDAARLAHSLARRGLDARIATGWDDATAGGVACITLSVDSGFSTPDLLVLDAAPLVRDRAVGAAAALGFGDGTPRVGDVVVHLEHGAARLAGLKPHGDAERIALAFADSTELLVDPGELDRIWRYGSAGTLDRLGGDAWRTKRAEIEGEITAAAVRFTEAAAARAARSAPVLQPDRAAYDRLARRFPYALSADQQAAVDAVLADLARGGPPMNRLVCGDVGFGKTEVALRAMAAAALCGYQVALAAPTTVLARQHLETVRRRFADTGIRVEALMSGCDVALVRQGLADGSIGIVVGTQALAAEGVHFRKLGLAVIDEEQRFGEAQKEHLCKAARHVLTMSATPIPRTLQSAMVGLREVSVIATAPVSRQATRTFVLPFDPELVREALRREHARGGQSFVVAPRISDLAGLQEVLHRLVPGLQVVQAHGQMKPEALEEAVMGFSAGHGDILLATNIIESGLDIPRANTIVVTGADRFGLAQLHQIRGRVGRGARRGAAYLFTAPGQVLAAPTLARLHTLEQLDSLGAGVAISAADLDQRGAGELFGSAQAGHVSALGTELYQFLLLQAVRIHTTGTIPMPPPQLHVELTGCIPAESVPEADLRLALYRRLARFETAAEIEDFGHEFADRFGDVPEPVHALMLLARLRCVGSAHGLARMEAGPRGAALMPYDGRQVPAIAKRLGAAPKGSRVMLPLLERNPAIRAAALVEMLS